MPDEEGGGADFRPSLGRSIEQLAEGPSPRLILHFFRRVVFGVAPGTLPEHE